MSPERGKNNTFPTIKDFYNNFHRKVLIINLGLANESKKRTIWT